MRVFCHTGSLCSCSGDLASPKLNRPLGLALGSTAPHSTEAKCEGRILALFPKASAPRSPEKTQSEQEYAVNIYSQPENEIHH